MMSERKRMFAMIGGLSGVLYLAADRFANMLPEFLLGALVGIALVFLVMSLLPEAALNKLSRWKRCG